MKSREHNLDLLQSIADDDTNRASDRIRAIAMLFKAAEQDAEREQQALLQKAAPQKSQPMVVQPGGGHPLPSMAELKATVALLQQKKDERIAAKGQTSPASVAPPHVLPPTGSTHRTHNHAR